MATINLGNIRFNWCGEYSETTTYYQDDVVGCNGSSYIAKKTTRGISTADRNIWDLMVAGAEKTYVIGEQKLMPFRLSELPPGWYFRNGDNYLLDSPPGRALDSLSANYKEDYKITIKVINGQQYINVPSAFASDGRGYFERAVDGTNRAVGSIENDAIRNITGQFLSFSALDAKLFYKQSAWAAGALIATSNSHGMSMNCFDASRVVPTANENRPLNIGMTPAIYLGV
ncbi:hypothetical protein [Gilliamella apis]|nr:hypothetical protein [Gilliamella apis]